MISFLSFSSLLNTLLMNLATKLSLAVDLMLLLRLASITIATTAIIAILIMFVFFKGTYLLSGRGH